VSVLPHLLEAFLHLLLTVGHLLYVFPNVRGKLSPGLAGVVNSAQLALKAQLKLCILVIRSPPALVSTIKFSFKLLEHIVG
jgi:hypothetical protein